MMKIAIVGFGASGFSCLKALHYYQGSTPLQVDIFSSSKQLVGGCAYQLDADYIRLNHHHQELFR